MRTLEEKVDEILNEAAIDTKSIYRVFKNIEVVLQKSGIKLSKETQKKIILALNKGIEDERWYICMGQPK